MTRQKSNAEFESVDTERLNNAHVYASAFGSDGAACQAALDEHGSNPSTVHLDVPVTALGTAAPLEVPSNTRVLIEADITLAGSTPENIIQTLDAYTQQKASGTLQDRVAIVGAGGVLDGNKANQTQDTDGFRQNCINLYGRNCRAVGVEVRDAQNHGIMHPGGGRHVTVRNCKVHGFSQSGIHGHYRSSGGNTADDEIVHGFRVINNEIYDGGSGQGVRFAGVEDGVVHANTIRDHTGVSDNHGIRIYQGDYPASNPKGNVVSDNTIRNVGGTGVFVDSSADSGPGSFGDVVISENTITAPTFAGIKLFARNEIMGHFVISGNTVQDGGDTGIDLDGGTAGLNGVSVSDNVLTSNSAAAIDPQGAIDECVYDGNIARGNGTDTISGTGTNSVVGDNVGL